MSSAATSRTSIFSRSELREPAFSRRFPAFARPAPFSVGTGQARAGTTITPRVPAAIPFQVFPRRRQATLDTLSWPRLSSWLNVRYTILCSYIEQSGAGRPPFAAILLWMARSLRLAVAWTSDTPSARRDGVTGQGGCAARRGGRAPVHVARKRRSIQLETSHD
jgi:hypothetical protein